MEFPSQITITSPLSGYCIPLQLIKDPVFADEILGKGIAIVPSDGKVFAPEDGLVTTLLSTGHAIGLQLKNGVELLIHVGVDTVSLNGIHFTKHVKQGQKVNKGDLLIEADLEKIQDAGYDTITPVIVCNSDQFSSVEGITRQIATLESKLIYIVQS